MRKANFTIAQNVWGWLLAIILTAFAGANLSAQCALACNNLVQISLDEDCSVELNEDMILEGNFSLTCPNGNFQVQAKINNVWTPAAGNFVANSAHIGQTIQVRVRDLNSGQSCWGYIKVEDKLSPEVLCEDIVVPCASTVYTPAYLANVLGISEAYPDATDNCSGVSSAYTDTWFDLPCGLWNGQDYSAYIRRIWTFADASGNTATCTQYIYLDRVHVYDVDFPADVTVDCTNPVTSPAVTGVPYYGWAGVEFPIYPNASYCELQAAYTDQVLPVCDGTYKILRTWTVYDWCLPTSPFPPTTNPQYYIQLIKVLDNQGPEFDCADDVTVSTDANTCCATVDLPSIIMTENCSRINHVQARVKVYDPYTGELIATHIVPGVLTTFPGNNLWASDTLANFGLTPCLPIGDHTVTLEATDDCGNHSECTYDLRVEDLTPPTAVCDEWTQVALGINGIVLVNASTFDDGSYDNCSSVHFKVRRMDSNPCQSNSRFYPQAKFCCEDIGDTITVVFRVYDVDPGTGEVGLEDYEDHYNDCMVQVLVEDKLKPACSAPANVTVSCEAFDPSLWAYGTATATDNCCVDTITSTLVLTQFDSLCNKGTITRRWTAKDCAGNTSQCSQRIIVTYNQNYWVKFPADKLVSTCDGTGNYGAPEFYGEDCELLATSFNDEIFTVIPDACYKIERTWTIINWCTYNPNLGCQYVPNPNPSNTTNAAANLPGVTVSPCGTTVLNWNPTVVKINPSDPSTTNYCTFWNKEANCYQYKQIIKIFDTQDPAVVTPTPALFCDYSTNDANFWSASYWWDATISSHDLCEGDANIEITATDACSGANISFHYLLFLDLDGNGSMETVVNSNNAPGFNNINFNNVGNQNYAGGEPRAFDGRPVNFNQKWGFGIQIDAASGNNRSARVRWFNQLGQNAVPQLPYGKHKIKWFITDGCGNETISEAPFEVKDCKKPTVVCLNGLSVNLMNIQGGMVQLWASDFLQYTEDNCTPADQLKIAIRRSGTGTGFPVNADGTPQTVVSFTCADLGTQLVELWSIDKGGNADFCETYVLIQDNAGVCGPVAGMASVAGALKNENTEGVENATIELNSVSNGTPNLTTQFSNISGTFAFSNALPIAANATITPTMELDPLNGVNTWDLVLISRHILGLEPLNTPYKLIAADANKSGTVTTFDIVEVRKLILGTYTQLPSNSSWRFIDKSQVFGNNQNPFADVIKENLQYANVQANMTNSDFVAAKIGDVDNTATPNQLVASDDRSAGTLFFDIADRKVAAGEEFTVNFNAAEKNGGYQFTMNLNNLEVVDVTPGTNMTTDNFAVFANAITTSVDANAGAFSVKFRAVNAGEISQMIGLSSRITKAESYNVDGARQEVAFRFNGQNGTVVGAGFELFQNTPNPVKNATSIAFNLPAAGEATLTITNVEGRVIKMVTGDFAKGLNTVSVNRTDLETGILFYQVKSGNFSAVKKMIVAE